MAHAVRCSLLLSLLVAGVSAVAAQSQVDPVDAAVATKRAEYAARAAELPATREDALAAQGFVRFRGRWMRKYDAVKLQHEAEQQRVLRKLQRDIDRRFRELVGASSQARRDALRALEDLAARRSWPELHAAARHCHDAAERYWAQQRVVLATVRAQHTELLGLEPFSTSLGTGLPVTLQLPRTRAISVGTTVGIPAGRGR